MIIMCRLSARVVVMMMIMIMMLVIMMIMMTLMFFAGDLQSSSAWTPSFSSGDQSEAASYL